MSELERFHELVARLDAAFWEADPRDFEFTFVAGAAQDLLGGDDGIVARPRAAPGVTMSIDR